MGCARAPELRLATLAALLLTGCSAPSARFEAAIPVELLANVDDDDRDGVRDALDERLNGEADLDDLTRVTLSTRCEGQALELHLEPAEHVRVFHSIDGRWEPLLGGERHHAPAACGETVLLIEALRPRSQVWSGAATLWVRAARVSAVLARLELSVVPVIFPDVTKPAARIYAVDIDEAEPSPTTVRLPRSPGPRVACR